MKMMDQDLMKPIINSILEQCNHIVKNLEIRLMKNDDGGEKSTLGDLCEKLSDR